MSFSLSFQNSNAKYFSVNHYVIAMSKNGMPGIYQEHQCPTCKGTKLVSVHAGKAICKCGEAMQPKPQMKHDSFLAKTAFKDNCASFKLHDSITKTLREDHDKQGTLKLRIMQAMDKLGFIPVGGRIKESVFWAVTKEAFNQVQKVFGTAANSMAYFSTLTSDIKEYRTLKAIMLPDENGSDGSSPVRQSVLVKKTQFRAIQFSQVNLPMLMAKGTLVPMADQEFLSKYGDYDLVIRPNQVKVGSYEEGKQITLEIGLTHNSDPDGNRRMFGSFELVQLLQDTQEVRDSLAKLIEKELSALFSIRHDREKLLSYLDSMEEPETAEDKSKLVALLKSNLETNDILVQNRLDFLYKKLSVKIIQSGGLVLKQKMATIDDSKAKAGDRYMVVRLPLRSAKGVQFVGNVDYLAADTAKAMDGDDDGDIIGYTEDPAIKRLFKKYLVPVMTSDKPAKGKDKTPLTLDSAWSKFWQQLMGFNLGSLTLQQSKAIAKEDYALASRIGELIQVSVMSLKHHFDREALLPIDYTVRKDLAETTLPWRENATTITSNSKWSDFKGAEGIGIVNKVWSDGVAILETIRNSYNDSAVRNNIKTMLSFKVNYSHEKSIRKLYQAWKSDIGLCIKEQGEAGIKAVCAKYTAIGSSLTIPELQASFLVSRETNLGLFYYHLSGYRQVQVIGKYAAA